MAKLTKYRLVNTEGVTELTTRHGNFYLGEIDDQVAEKLYYDKSRYVEKVEESEALPKKQEKAS